MKRKRFPDEAPVFEVLSDGEFVPRGEVVEGLGYWAGGMDTRGIDIVRHGIGVRVIDEDNLRREPRYGGRCPRDGWVGIHLIFKDVKPLTPAAVEMLKIAKRGVK